MRSERIEAGVTQDTAPKATPTARAASASRVSSPIAIICAGGMPVRFRIARNFVRLPNSDDWQA
ncbi:MAG: hypothetical protein ACXW3U_10295 [Rhodoplanes sp.]